MAAGIKVFASYEFTGRTSKGRCNGNSSLVMGIVPGVKFEDPRVRTTIETEIKKHLGQNGITGVSVTITSLQQV